MRLAATFLIVLSCSLSCSGAVIDGVVVEEETGYPLAWSQVSLIPLGGTKARAVTVRASNRGTFKMPDVPGGWYVLRTSREGFASDEVGQMRPGRPGIPFELTAAGHNFFQIRMRRMGAVSGTLLDQNNVGVPDWPVQVYTGHKPFRRVSSGTTDNRGVFRIGLLEAGSYVVRSAGGTTEEGTSLVPAYFQYGTSFDSAEPVRVRVGQTTPDITIHTVRGRLFSVSGTLTGPAGARVALVTESGRATVATIPPSARGTVFEAQGLSPGPVELLVEGSQCAGYTRLAMDRDLAGVRMTCGALSTPSFEWTAGTPFPIQTRRVDLDQTAPAHAVGEREQLIPGRYEIMPQTGDDFYVESVERASPGQGWFALDLSNSPKVGIAVSSHPASISGKVSSGGQPLPGAMVYLERIDLPQLWTQRADVDGGYRFGGLAPGSYRALSSFDFDPDDPRPMNAAAVIDLKEGDKVSQPLELALP